MPKGYLIANVTVTDPDRYAAYRQQVPAVIEQFGGRFLVRAGALDRVEDADGFDRVVVLEFEFDRGGAAVLSQPRIRAAADAARAGDAVACGVGGGRVRHQPAR